MTVELRPLGVHCNIACQYCYQNPQRSAGNLRAQYDMGRMKQALEQEGVKFRLFGGEPLLLPEDVLEELWAFGLERFGYNGVQTNGTLINERHIELFRKYQVAVGISCDGPGELSDVRWAGSLAATREATQRTEDGIARLCKEGMPPALILTLHRGNATPDKLPVMERWLHSLEQMGVTTARLHILEVDDPQVRAKCALTTEENIEAFLFFARAEAGFRTLHFDVFEEMRQLLLGEDGGATCVWRACDPYTTSAVRGVEGQGQRSNCGRTNKDGVDFVKAEFPGYERYLALFHTDQEAGGCNGCRFFLMCKGQCPGTSIDGDWRNRSEHCEVWMALFQHFEDGLRQAGKAPLSTHPIRAQLESWFLDAWARGENPNMETLLAANRGQFEG
jgi:uncharacterized protein